MKTLTGPGAKNSSRLRKKRLRNPVSDEIHQIAHNLLNQLSVINLCSFKLHGESTSDFASAMANDLEALERAVQDATRLAEQLAQAIVESGPIVEPGAPTLVKLRHQTNNILPFFAPQRR